MRRKEIRVQTLVLVAAVTGIASFAVFTVITRSGALVPRPSLLSGVLLVVMGGLVLWLARPVRRYLQGRATTTLEWLPLRRRSHSNPPAAAGTRSYRPLVVAATQCCWSTGSTAI